MGTPASGVVLGFSSTRAPGNERKVLEPMKGIEGEARERLIRGTDRNTQADRWRETGAKQKRETTRLEKEEGIGYRETEGSGDKRNKNLRKLGNGKRRMTH